MTEKSREWRRDADSFKGRGYNKRLRFINYTGQYLFFHENGDVDDLKSDVCDIAIRHMEIHEEKSNIILKLRNGDSATYHIMDRHVPLLDELDKIVGGFAIWMLKKMEEDPRPTPREIKILKGLQKMALLYRQRCKEFNRKSGVFRNE